MFGAVRPNDLHNEIIQRIQLAPQVANGYLTAIGPNPIAARDRRLRTVHTKDRLRQYTPKLRLGRITGPGLWANRNPDRQHGLADHQDHTLTLDTLAEPPVRRISMLALGGGGLRADKRPETVVHSSRAAREIRKMAIDHGKLSVGLVRARPLPSKPVERRD